MITKLFLAGAVSVVAIGVLAFVALLAVLLLGLLLGAPSVYPN